MEGAWGQGRRKLIKGGRWAQSWKGAGVRVDEVTKGVRVDKVTKG